MSKIDKEYFDNMRNLVSVYLVNYANTTFDDDYKEAHEFLLNYSFGKNRGSIILELERKYTISLEKIIKRKRIAI